MKRVWQGIFESEQAMEYFTIKAGAGIQLCEKRDAKWFERITRKKYQQLKAVLQETYGDKKTLAKAIVRAQQILVALGGVWADQRIREIFLGPDFKQYATPRAKQIWTQNKNVIPGLCVPRHRVDLVLRETLQELNDTCNLRAVIPA